MPQRQLQAIRQCGGLQTLWCVAQCSYPPSLYYLGRYSRARQPLLQATVAAMTPYYRANKPY